MGLALCCEAGRGFEHGVLHINLLLVFKFILTVNLLVTCLCSLLVDVGYFRDEPSNVLRNR